MLMQTKIICPKCGKDTGMIAENFQNYYLSYDIRCPYCDTVIIYATKVVC